MSFFVKDRINDLKAYLLDFDEAYEVFTDQRLYLLQFLYYLLLLLSIDYFYLPFQKAFLLTICIRTILPVE